MECPICFTTYTSQHAADACERECEQEDRANRRVTRPGAPRP